MLIPRKLIVVLIFTIGLFLRVVAIDQLPAGFTPDEASFGYDAYSLLKTGKDQWGISLPLVFKSFGDDKLPVYTYLTVPSIAVFGLNEFAVRLPNALVGTFAILATYLLIKNVFKDETMAVLGSFLLAISPWHIMLSRGAFEANLTTLFLTLGILFYFKGLKNPRLLIVSMVFFVVNLFTYHTARIITPLVAGFLLIAYKDELMKLRKFWFWSVCVLGVTVIALIGYLGSSSRLVSSGILDMGFGKDRYLAQMAGEPNVISKIFYNKPVYIARQFLTNYLSYFSPQFLITNGPAEGTYGMVPGVGVIYLIEAVFLLGFVVKSVREGVKREELLFVFWIVVSTIPASLSKGPGFAANRAAFMMPALQVIIAIGALFIYQKLLIETNRRIFLVVCSLLIIVNFIYVSERYVIGQKVSQASQMLFGVSYAVGFLNSVENSYNEIIVSKNISEPHIYIAFYSKIDPDEFQKSSKEWRLVNGWVDQQEKYTLGKYTFKSIDRITDFKKQNTLLVGRPQDFPSETKFANMTYYPSGDEAIGILSQ